MFIQHVHEYIKKTIFMKCLANHTSGKLKCLFATSLSETMEFKKNTHPFQTQNMAETMGTKHFWSQDQSSGLESHELAPEIADKSMWGSLRRGVISENEVFINFFPWKWGKSNSGTPSALRANTATQNAKPQDTPWKNTFEKIWANRNNSQTYKSTNFIAKLAHPTQNHFSWLFSRRILPFISKDSD